MRRGEIVVGLAAQADQVELQVRDNGVGLSPALNLESAKSLGLRIVHILARRLDAHLEIESRDGAAFIITFPLHADAPVEPR